MLPSLTTNHQQKQSRSTFSNAMGKFGNAGVNTKTEYSNSSSTSPVKQSASNGRAVVDDDSSASEGKGSETYNYSIDHPNRPTKAAGGSNANSIRSKRVVKNSNEESHSTQTIIEVIIPYTKTSKKELSLKAGDIVRIISKKKNNFLKGEVNGKIGIFPADCVHLVHVKRKEKKKNDLSEANKEKKIGKYDKVDEQREAEWDTVKKTKEMIKEGKSIRLKGKKSKKVSSEEGSSEDSDEFENDYEHAKSKHKREIRHGRKTKTLHSSRKHKSKAHTISDEDSSDDMAVSRTRKHKRKKAKPKKRRNHHSSKFINSETDSSEEFTDEYGSEIDWSTTKSPRKPGGRINDHGDRNMASKFDSDPTSKDSCKAQLDILHKASAISIQRVFRGRLHRKIAAEKLMKVIVIQGFGRIILAKESVNSAKKELAKASGVLIACKGTTQGKTGWYEHDAGVKYYFELIQGKWNPIYGPMSDEVFSDIVKQCAALRNDDYIQLPKLKKSKKKRFFVNRRLCVIVK